MQKINTLYVRGQQNPSLVTRDMDDSCRWVLDGEAIVTEKFDGSACLIREGVLYRRHVVREGKAQPLGWLHHSFNLEQASGHGWAPVTGSTSDQWHREAQDRRLCEIEGTYELVGPKVQKNPHRLEVHRLWRHGVSWWPEVPTDFDGLREWLAGHSVEGIVWHHPDGRMAKIKRRDFGLPWPVKEAPDAEAD